jgi:hypothetical protein
MRQNQRIMCLDARHSPPCRFRKVRFVRNGGVARQGSDTRQVPAYVASENSVHLNGRYTDHGTYAVASISSR